MAQVSWVRQLALASVLFLLGSLAYWMEFKRKPEQESKTEQSRKLFTLKDTPIQSIRLSDGSGTYELSCLDFAAKLCKPGDNSKWELVKPSRFRADDSSVNSLVSALNNLTSTETIDLKDETPEKRAALLKEYGLDPAARDASAARKVTVATPAGETTIHLGLMHPIGEGIFALASKDGKAEESRIHIIPSHFKTSFEHDLVHWRNKKLLTLAAHEIDFFDLESGKGRIRGERKDGLWSLVSGKEQVPGDIENIDSLLSGATMLSAKSFPSDNKEDAKAGNTLKGAKNALTLTLGKKEDRVTVRLLAKANRVFATVSNVDPLFELEASAKDRLDKSLKDLRLNKLVTSMERFSAKRLEFSGKPVGAEPVVLVSKDGKWSFEKGQGEVNADKVQSTLEKLSGSRIKDFLTGAAIPAGEKDGLQFSLGDDKNPAKRKYVFWKSGSQLYARDLLSQRKEAFLVDSAVSEGLPWSPDFFKKAAK